MADVNLEFKEGDPGAVIHGNFINYYQFHGPEQRMEHFPTNLWKTHYGKKFICLDIGCNTGMLTSALFKFISKNLEILPGTKYVDLPADGISIPTNGNTTSDCVILALDIDPTLINRAQELSMFTNNITYKCLDFVCDKKEDMFSSFLTMNGNSSHFDVIFCFSITMWIHLNHGDEGLKQFLTDVTKWAKILVIEPQPWKCYRNAVRRLKRSSGEAFPLFNSLKLTTHVEREIEQIIIGECGFKKLMETPLTSWGRQILFFTR